MQLVKLFNLAGQTSRNYIIGKKIIKEIDLIHFLKGR